MHKGHESHRKNAFTIVGSKFTQFGQLISHIHAPLYFVNQTNDRCHNYLAIGVNSKKKKKKL